jgi:hypothetical protein
MGFFARIAVAFALSLVASGALQQAIMFADEAAGSSSALPPLGGIVLLVTVVFGIVLWWRRTSFAANLTAACLMAFTLMIGLAAYIGGVLTLSPGIGGNIGYGLALILDFYFLLPAAVAVAIHWLLLRGAVRRISTPADPG